MTSSIPESMVAYRFHPGYSEPVAQRISVPSPSPDQVLVKILAGGVCHSDLSLIDHNNDVHKVMLQDKAKKFTIGHEGSGIIVSLGSAVPSSYPELILGAYVATYAIDACFESSCDNCTRGLSGLCTYRAHGLNIDGFWAPYAAIRAACVVRVPGTPATIPPGVVSTATDAVLTPYHAMKACCRLQPAHTVLCVGIGGLGHSAVAIAKRCLGVRCVIACDVRAAALEGVRDAAADYVATPDELAALVAEHALRVDFAFDFVGSQKTFDLCFSVIRPGGTIHVMGIAHATLNVPPLITMAKELTYKTSSYGSKEELKEVLQAIADGVLKPKVEMRPMREAAQVLRDMRDGKLTGRVALQPEGE